MPRPLLLPLRDPIPGSLGDPELLVPRLVPQSPYLVFFCCGGEAAAEPGIPSHWTGGSGSPAGSTLHPRTGTKGLVFPASDIYVSPPLPTTQVIVGRASFYLGAYPAGGLVERLFDWNDGGWRSCELRDDGLLTIGQPDGAGGVGGTLSLAVMPLSQQVDIDFRIDARVNPHTIDWQINGVAQTQNTIARAAVNFSGLDVVGAVTTVDLYADDIAFSAYPNAYPLGPGTVVLTAGGTEVWVPDVYPASTGSSLVRTAVDAITQSDAATRAMTLLRNSTDAFTSSDAATRLGTFLRSATDSTTYADAATAVRSFLRTATDSITWADSASRIGTFARTVTDSVTRSDAATRLGTFLRTATDSTTWSDVATQTKTILRNVTDSVTYSDVTTRLGTFSRTATDSTTYSDAATRLGTFARAVTDSVTRSDAATRIGTFLRTVTDSTTWSDAATAATSGAANLVRTVTDSITWADTAVRSGTFTRTVTDAVARADVATRAGTFLRTATDSTTYADAATRAVAAVRTAADSITRSDAATRIGTFLRAATDATTYSDLAAAIGGGISVVGGFPPIAFAVSLIPRIVAAVLGSEGSASSPTPGASAADPTPGASASHPTPKE